MPIYDFINEKTGKEWTSENLWRVRFVPLLEGTVEDIKSAV